jgi:hypothetical protein
LKVVKSNTAAILQNYRIVIFSKVEVDCSLTEYNYSKDPSYSNIKHAKRFITTNKIGIPYSMLSIDKYY